MKKLAPYVSHDAEQLREFRARPEMAIMYLNMCIEDGFKDDEPKLILHALSQVAKALGVTRVAKDAKLKRESVHRMLSKRGNPRWDSIVRLLKAMNLQPKLARVETKAAR